MCRYVVVCMYVYAFLYTDVLLNQVVEKGRICLLEVYTSSCSFFNPCTVLFFETFFLLFSHVLKLKSINPSSLRKRASLLSDNINGCFNHNKLKFLLSDLVNKISFQHHETQRYPIRDRSPLNHNDLTLTARNDEGLKGNTLV